MRLRWFRWWMLLGLVLPVACSVLAAGELGLMPMGISFVAMLFVLPVLLAALMISLLCRAYWRDYRAAFSRMAAGLAVAAVSVALLLPAAFLGVAVGQMRLDRARSGVGPTVEALERYKQEAGRYPASLEEAARAGHPIPVPWFAAGYSYRGGADDFSLTLMDPFSLMDGWHYDTEDRRWIRDD
jgi:hypothetical protein